MPTEKQKLGDWGEKLVRKTQSCPKCKRAKTLRQLPPNFKCADLICDFCGYLTQVKTTQVTNVNVFPERVSGAAWPPQKDRMDAGIYFPLYVVVTDKKNRRNYAIYYLSADLQTPEMFIPRKPLSKSAKRAGWQGYYFDGALISDRATRIL